MATSFSIIVPTRDRCHVVKQLLESIKQLQGLERIYPEIIIGDNNSNDQTWDKLQQMARDFFPPLRLLKVAKPGKSAVLNKAIEMATGNILAFLDDDVAVDPTWLEAIEEFFCSGNFSVGQGVVRIPSPESEDLEIQRLLQRYRTIPHLEFGPFVQHVHSLNGANFAVSRRLLEKVGKFDERLGPGASGTSEDVEFAQRILQTEEKIGYIREAIVYHQVDRSRLTEDYFKLVHKRQGRSRLVFKNHGTGHIIFDLCRASAQFGFYSLAGEERNLYRSKGRIYHYLGMLEAKWNG